MKLSELKAHTDVIMFPLSPLAKCSKSLGESEQDEAGCHKMKPEMHQISRIHTSDSKVKDTGLIIFPFNTSTSSCK